MDCSTDRFHITQHEVFRNDGRHACMHALRTKPRKGHIFIALSVSLFPLHDNGHMSVAHVFPIMVPQHYKPQRKVILARFIQTHTLCFEDSNRRCCLHFPLVSLRDPLRKNGCCPSVRNLGQEHCLRSVFHPLVRSLGLNRPGRKGEHGISEEFLKPCLRSGMSKIRKYEKKKC